MVASGTGTDRYRYRYHTALTNPSTQQRMGSTKPSHTVIFSNTHTYSHTYTHALSVAQDETNADR